MLTTLEGNSATLEACSFEEVQSVLWDLSAKHAFSNGTYCHVIQVYDNDVLRVQHVRICSSEFENYRKHIHDDGSDSQLSTSRTKSAAR
jgi:hypothetical protein